MEQISSKFKLVFDTNEYAGNFERQMVAFVTGIIGECQVGEEEQEIFNKECPTWDLSNLVDTEPDEHGCCRPAVIWPSPYFWNDGLGNHHSASVELHSKHAQEEYRKAVINWAEQAKSIYAHMPDYAESEYTRILDENKSGPSRKHAAYMSVCCHLSHRPDAEILTKLVARAKKFCEVHTDFDGENYGLELLGVRLIEVITTEREEKIL